MFTQRLCSTPSLVPHYTLDQPLLKRAHLFQNIFIVVFKSIGRLFTCIYVSRLQIFMVGFIVKSVQKFLRISVILKY